MRAPSPAQARSAGAAHAASTEPAQQHAGLMGPGLRRAGLMEAELRVVSRRRIGPISAVGRAATPPRPTAATPALISHRGATLRAAATADRATRPPAPSVDRIMPRRAFLAAPTARSPAAVLADVRSAAAAAPTA